ncbi:MAG: DNA repair protein RecN [Spirochaetes bacterium GWB1_48_6]|nr:MAG: DNA repair protein RecN [Spirochaetes bacterium GWB1_48_6]
MLEELTVQNFVLFEKARIPFKPGLNVLTGETGAGKSILVGAMGLLLGAKGESGFIRSGQDEAHLSAVFSLPPNSEELKTWMEENGLSLEEGTLILRRILRQTNRSSCYLGASPVTRQQMEDLTGYLVDLHGQHEHQSLFIMDVHRKMLDQYLGLEPEIRDFSGEYSKLSQLRQQYEDFCKQAEYREEEIFRLNNLVQDIFKAKLKVGEEEELSSKKKRLDQHEKLFSALTSLGGSLWEGRGSALGQLKQSLGILGGITSLDPLLEDAGKRLDSLFLELEDVTASLHDYTLGLDFSPEVLKTLEDRLSLIYSLEKKYAPTVEKLLELEVQSRGRLSQLESGEETKNELFSSMKNQEKLVLFKAAQLTEKRKIGAKSLTQEILRVLQDLGMAKVRFEILVQPRSGEGSKALVGPSGADSVEFLISPNPGEPLRPLKETASGGELSRVMLALKSVLSEADNIPVLVFDEIDTGIGGEIGMSLGRYLKKISLGKQVICITHLASIASFADHHLQIEKIETEGRTVTSVRSLGTPEREREIARMLSGSVSDASLEHARELISANG